jgi:hypothetical protein
MVRDAGTCAAAVPASIAAPSASHPLKRCLCAMFLILASRRLPYSIACKGPYLNLASSSPIRTLPLLGTTRTWLACLARLYRDGTPSGTDSNGQEPRGHGTKREQGMKAALLILLFPVRYCPGLCSYGVIGVVIPRSVNTFGFFSSTASKLWHAAQSCVIAVPFCAVWSPSWQRKQPG